MTTVYTLVHDTYFLLSKDVSNNLLLQARVPCKGRIISCSCIMDDENRAGL